jgi:hypothetical protein
VRSHQLALAVASKIQQLAKCSSVLKSERSLFINSLKFYYIVYKKTGTLFTSSYSGLVYAPSSPSQVTHNTNATAVTGVFSIDVSLRSSVARAHHQRPSAAAQRRPACAPRRHGSGTWPASLPLARSAASRSGVSN